ncbi:hypothetical protein, partial [Escherichia coli]|uniref:hypothetical protein n=1 Tax=Escherichia coli TaxID=562 RepID=UPI0022359C06
KRQTGRCFNKSKGVLITGSKLKAFRNPQPSWGFSVHKKIPTHGRDIDGEKELTAVAEDPQQHQEQVDEVQIQG